MSFSNIHKDPRATRSIGWLASEGWIVDSLGVGETSSAAIRDHFPLRRLPAWSDSLAGKGLIHLLLPYIKRFQLLMEARIPREISLRVGRGDYDLLVFNDLYFIPWVSNRKTFSPTNVSTRCHLDLYEYHPKDLAKNSPWRLLVNGYYRWQRRFIGSPQFHSRSVVASGIADLYAREFDVPLPTVVRNCPPYEVLRPSDVQADRIELVYHGIAGWQRGLRQLVDALRLVDRRFSLNLMLTKAAPFMDELHAMVEGMADRVTFLPPVAMADVAKALNRFDLEVMFFPPITQNLHFALPNKLFEAVQGRLGLVIGPSPMMAEIIDEYSNGVVASGWKAKDLAAVLNTLTAEQISAMKDASDSAAKDLSAEHEKESFLRSIQPK